MKLISFLLSSFISLSILSCDCKINKNIDKGDNISIDELKSIILKDTHNYKLVVFFDQLCYPCVMHIDSFYTSCFSESNINNAICIMITKNAMSKQEVSEFFYNHELNKNVISYNLYDTVYRFSCMDDNRWDNILNHITQYTDSINGLIGLPISFVLDAHNRIKIKIKKDNHKFLKIPVRLDEINCNNLDEINFYEYEYDTTNII